MTCETDIDPAGRLRVVVGMYRGPGPDVAHAWLTWDGAILDWLADGSPRDPSHWRYVALGSAVVK